MSSSVTSVTTSDSKASPNVLQSRKRWFEWTYLPLLLALLITLLVRIALIIHTGGVLDGDESLVGIQAQHILHGEHPAYFYGQVYMGSLEAYLIAALFAIFGSSVWVLRAEPILLSLVIVWATWRFADILAEGAQLRPREQHYFRVCAALCAAIAPLYDVVLELRMLGGYIEIFIVMLLLLLATVRLTQRWHAGTTWYELAARWAGIGFLAGLGFWVNPLLAPALFTIALWLVAFFIKSCIVWRSTEAMTRHESFIILLRGVLTAVVALSAACIGAAPALRWGARNHWLNVKYMFGRGGHPSFIAIKAQARLYLSCVAEHTIGGSLPGENLRAMLLHALPLTVGIGCIAGAGCLLGLSFIRHNRRFWQVRQLLLMPALFAAATAIFFVFVFGLPIPLTCADRDIVGRYATPLMLVLPFFIATIYTFFIRHSFYTAADPRRDNPLRLSALDQDTHMRPGQPQGIVPTRVGRALQWVETFRNPAIWLSLILLAMLGTQALSYLLTNPGLTFQTPYCRDAPANNEQIIAYMQRNHIRYAWATFWVGNPIIFKTNEHIIVADPRAVVDYGTLVRTGHATSTDRAAVFAYVHTREKRLPGYIEDVYNADRPSILAFIAHGDPHPHLLALLDQLGITYRTAIFPSETGVDILLVTPLNKTVPLLAAGDFHPLIAACPSQWGADVPDVS